MLPKYVGTLKRQDDVTWEIKNATVQISEAHMIKILQELLGNACKFSEPGMPVTILGVRQENQYILSIQDRGYGMTKEQVSQVGAFIQFDRMIREQQGMGLGLEICYRLVKLHGGELSIDSIPDHGTTVTLTLNICEDAEAV
jgi:signal transduction histidine kinase